jgi:hypothetical protein
MAVKGASREALLNLLQIYEAAIAQLESASDPRLNAMGLRLKRRCAEVQAALAEQS